MEEKNKFMASALKCAEKALTEGEVPIGAVVVLNGKFIARGHNRRTKRPRRSRSHRKGVQKIEELAHTRMRFVRNFGALPYVYGRGFERPHKKDLLRRARR